MEYLIHIAIIISIYSILSLGLNLILGYTGQLSLTHAAFFGIGAYAIAIGETKFHLNFFLALLIGIVVAGLLAIIIGIFLGRFRRDIYALASLGTNVILFSIFLNWTNLTRGPLGIPGIRRPEIFGFIFQSNFSFLLLCAFFSYLTYTILHRLLKTPFGLTLKAIREDEDVLSSFGYKVKTIKTTAFVISAIFTAIAGRLLASYITFIDPSTFDFNESIYFLSVVIIGGLADLRGSILGTIILVILPEALRFLGLPSDLAANLRQILYGLALIMMILFRPQGFLGKYKM
ncbi:MAG TPA: branched-chain amino acid ABC transporter permease [Candidatus Magasanikbacteria bacterium]|nr:branched-chain amino acid ABC transporter permease [Candidatus Magasanikbacteria bacterium]